MTNKEILLSAINLQITSRVPAIILSSGVWTYYRHGLSLQDAFDMHPDKVADIVIKNNEEVGSDLIWTGADCSNVALRAMGAKTTFNRLGGASTIDMPLISNAEDVNKLRIDNLENDSEIDNLLRTTRILSERVGKQYLIGISQWGPFTFAGQLMGLERFLSTTIRDVEAAKYVLDFAQRVVTKYLELFLEAGAELACQAEPTSSGDIISPKMFNSLSLPYIKRVNNELENKATAKMLHICGNTTKLLELIPESGTDIYSFDYKVNLTDAKEKLAGKVAFAGQIDPVSILLDGTVEEVTEAVEKCVQTAGAVPGYILMPGCDIPPETKIENVKAMISVTR